VRDLVYLGIGIVVGVVVGLVAVWAWAVKTWPRP
jgi:hypothetical protein